VVSLKGYNKDPHAGCWACPVDGSDAWVRPARIWHPLAECSE